MRTLRWVLAVVAIVLVAGATRRAGAGAVFISGDDADDDGHCEESNCGQMMGHILSDLYAGCEPLPTGNCILHIGTNSDNARSALLGDLPPFIVRLGWNHPANGGPNACLVECNTLNCIQNVVFSDYRVLYVASSGEDPELTTGGLTQLQLNALNTRAGDIQNWVNNQNGRVLALTEARMINSYGWLPNPLTSADFVIDNRNRTPKNATRIIDPIAPPSRTIDLEFPGNGSTDANLDHFAYHNYFTGPAGYSGLRLFVQIDDAPKIQDPNNPSRLIQPPVIVGCCQCQINNNAPPSCDAGGPYATDCRSAAIDGATASDAEDEALTYVWTSNNPDVSVTPANGNIAAGPGVRPVPPSTAILAETSLPCSLTAQLTLTVVDSSGNLSICDTTVTFDDNLAPVIDDPADATVECDAVPGPASPAASDSCDPAPAVSFQETQSAETCPGSYTITRTWTASDACTNSASATQTITVQDTTDPVLAGVPADQTVECDAVPAPASPTATDNCDPAPPVSLIETASAPTCPGSYTITRTWTATDGCGNAVSDSQVITVQDTTDPVLSGVPADQTVECDAVPPKASPTATDNCDNQPALTFQETQTPATCPGSYTITRTWTASDGCGNAVSDSQVITVQDTTDPVLSGVPADETVECDAVPPPASPTVTDNCDPAPALVFSEQKIDGTCPNNYTLVRTWTATDGCGNTVSDSQTVTVQDTTDPVISGVPADQTVECDAVPPPASPTVSDNCDPDPDLTFAESKSPETCPGSYVLTRTWTATDQCSNQVVESQVITVVDTTPPVLVDCGLDPVAPMVPGSPGSAVSPGSPRPPASPGSAKSCPASGAFKVRCGIATDNCDTQPVVQAEIVVQRHEVIDQVCILKEDIIPVNCDDIVNLRLVAPPCPAKAPRSPRPPASPVSASSQSNEIVGERITLRVRAMDGCGNLAVPCLAEAALCPPKPAKCASSACPLPPPL